MEWAPKSRKPLTKGKLHKSTKNDSQSSQGKLGNLPHSVTGIGAKRKLVGLAGCTAGRELRLTRELIELDGG